MLDPHEKVLHHSIKAILRDVRSKFWIFKWQEAVKSVLHKYVTCRRYQGRSLLPPGTLDLPGYRVHTLYGFQL